MSGNAKPFTGVHVDVATVTDEVTNAAVPVKFPKTESEPFMATASDGLDTNVV